MEWEPKLRTRLVGLLMNVLAYRFRDDIPTKLAAFERTVHDHENQTTKRVTMLGDGGHASQRTPHPEQRQDHKLESDARRDSRDHANPTVHRQSTNANAARSESEEQGHGQRERQQGQRQGQGCKERTVQESKERRSETGHVNAECRKRLKDLADAEEKPVAATPHPMDTATVVPLQCFLPDERHPSTIIIAMPCANNETSCNSSNEHTVMRPGAGSIAPAETKRVRPIAAIPSNETYLMMDTSAGGSIFPRGFDLSATHDPTVAPV